MHHHYLVWAVFVTRVTASAADGYLDVFAEAAARLNTELARSGRAPVTHPFQRVQR